MAKPEVHVRSVRRRRTEPPPPPASRPLNIRNWLMYAGLATLVAALMLDGFLRDHPQHPLPKLSYAVEVRSTLAEIGDSLQVVVSWDLTLSDPEGRPDSVLIKVTPGQGKPAVLTTQTPNQLADTVYLQVPQQGETLAGLSCVQTEHDGYSVDESCTPWQYVRPTAAPAGTVSQIMIKPSGLQVDPDVGGRCAQWQRAHPDRSVWIQVNVTAVPECTGPNHKPAVAQFCAFAVLPGGKRVKTATSSNNSYCDELFVEWSRELYS